MKLSERPWEGLPVEIAPAIRGRVAEAVEDVIATVPLHIPEYRQPGRDLEEALDRVRVGTEYGLSCFADLIDRPASRVEDQKELYRTIGRATHDRGASLHAMNHVFRVIARIGWHWIERIGTGLQLPPVVVLRAAEALYVYMDELASFATEGYNEATIAAAGERHERRSQLLDMLLLTSAVPITTLREAAGRAAWPLPTTIAAVALGPGERASELAGRIAPDVLAGARGGTPFLLIGDPDAPGRPALVATALTGHAAAIGPTTPLAFAHRSLAWARRCLALAATTSPGPDQPPLRAEDHLISLLLSDDTPLLQTLIDRRLQPLQHLTPAARTRLSDTLLAWLERDGSAPAAARVLHTHPGTVRYRVAKLRELFGEALDEPAQRFELQLALRARRLLATGEP